MDLVSTSPRKKKFAQLQYVKQLLTCVFFLCFTEQQKKRTTLYLIVLSSSTNSTKKNAQATKEDIL